MDNRRDFVKKMMLLSGAAGIASMPSSIAKAMAIDPAPGSTFLDAEHIVILMQENRSFDHAFGTLRGVRGFNDPRAMHLPNNNKVWLQTNANNETYTPFRFDIKDTKITWMGSLPHGRQSQVDARNDGRMDNWLEAKKSGDEDYGKMPLTMGYYTREDIPFYYALADAFTVCDQNFCSSLTGTDPNRVHFWSGTVRAEHDENAKAYVDNGDIESGIEWRTFPELLEDNDISWKVYQNELYVDGGFVGDEESWLSNFGDNCLEFFNQYNVKLTDRYLDFLPKRIELLQTDIKDQQAKLQTLQAGTDEYKNTEQHLKYVQQYLDISLENQKKFTKESFDNLNEKQKNIHNKAFVVNSADPNQHKLTPLNYVDDNINREINIPKGDILYQFREDVKNGTLPTISWLVAPENFSDHPSAPWFGSWYLSETMDILTQNPDVWKKTIFILAYDENDGYFDHVSPFTAPKHNDASTGLVSDGIDTSLDHVLLKEDAPGPIGLGYRVPLVIASPWSRGGFVNSEVFDHTSTLQFLETFLNKKFNKQINEDNITPWRRMVCGDLTSTFQSFDKKPPTQLPFLKIDPFVESIHKAKFKNVPSNFKQLSADEIAQLNKNPHSSPYMPQQEKGIRAACAIPYELYVDGNVNTNNAFEISMNAATNVFKEKAVGAPFIIHARNYLQKDFTEKTYAVKPGDTLKDNFKLNDFNNGNYDVQVFGPNGFFRSFIGNNNENIFVNVLYDEDANHKLNGNIKLLFAYNGNKNYNVIITDNAYKSHKKTIQLSSNKKQESVVLDLKKSYNWYDFSVHINGNNTFEKRYAGHVETGATSKSDPLMGMEV